MYHETATTAASVISNPSSRPLVGDRPSALRLSPTSPRPGGTALPLPEDQVRRWGCAVQLAYTRRVLTPVNMMQPLADGLIVTGRLMFPNRAPMLGVGPGLVAVQVAEPVVRHSGKRIRLPDYAITQSPNRKITHSRDHPITLPVVMIWAEWRCACSAA